MALNNDQATIVSTPPPPPQAGLNPLITLNRYLAGLETLDNTVDSSTIASNRQDEILQTVDFLYGSALDGALSVLESFSNYVSGPTSSAVATAVTRLQSPHRSLYTVSASTTTARGGRGGPSWHQHQQQQDSCCYLCIIPAENNHDHPEDSDTGIYYCSCRSFLEKCRSTSSGGGSLCKHLLALKLMPFLGLTCPTVRLASEEELSRALLQRLLPPS